MSIDESGAERLWTAAAGMCLGIALVALLWKWNVEVAFVAAALGAVSWFLSMRDRLKKIIVAANRVEENEHSRDDNESE